MSVKEHVSVVNVKQHNEEKQRFLKQEHGRKQQRNVFQQEHGIKQQFDVLTVAVDVKQSGNAEESVVDSKRARKRLKKKDKAGANVLTVAVDVKQSGDEEIRERPRGIYRQELAQKLTQPAGCPNDEQR